MPRCDESASPYAEGAWEYADKSGETLTLKGERSEPRGENRPKAFAAPMPSASQGRSAGPHRRWAFIGRLEATCAQVAFSMICAGKV